MDNGQANRRSRSHVGVLSRSGGKGRAGNCGETSSALIDLEHGNIAGAGIDHEQKAAETIERLVRLPGGVRGKQAADEADLVADEETEGQTQDSGAGDQAAIQPGKTVPCEREGKRDGAGD
jgi:hypothetical protein